MKSKLFGAKSMTNIIYGLVMLLPFCAILGRVIYTQSNPNAKDSYSDNNITNLYNITSSNASSLLNQGATLYFNYSSTQGSYDYSGMYEYTYLSFNPQDYGYTGTNYTRIIYYSNGNLGLYNADTLQTDYRSNIWGTKLTSFTIKYKTGNFVNGGNGKIYLVITSKSSIDNAFEYSLDTFVKDNANLNSIDFFSWFDGLFLNQSNGHNLLYLNFANWYMNYALLVSSGYLLFLALMWFINYVRRILDKSMNHDFGGF